MSAAKSRALRSGAALLVAGAGVLLVKGVVFEPNNVREIRVTVPASGAERPLRVLLFSDVDFHEVGTRERAVAAAAQSFNPDVVLVAGDLLNRLPRVGHEGRVDAAGAFVRGLPARAGRFLVPGEDESSATEALTARWGRAVDLLSNERRLLSVGSTTVDLFGAHRRVDVAPWPLGREGARTFVYSRTRPNELRHRLLCTAPAAAAWRDIEVTFAFRAADAKSRVELRVGWSEPDGPGSGHGYRVGRPEWRRDFRVYTSPPSSKQLVGHLESGFEPPSGSWCRARVKFGDEGSATRILARFWLASDPEPTGWMIDGSDATPQRARAGTIALGGGPGERAYTDVRVVDASGMTVFVEPAGDLRALRERWSSGSALERWIEDQRPGTLRVLLVHDPEIARDVADLGGNRILVLAGHTHGGQARIPGLGALYTGSTIGRRYDRGLFDYRGVPLYITAGVGTSGLPIRLFDPPEVTLLTVVPPPLATSSSVP